MKTKDYQELAKRTCASLGNEKLDLAHMVLGIISEQEELMKALAENDVINQNEELADICWYLANYCTFRGYDFAELVREYRYDIELEGWETQVQSFDLFTSKLADYVKKYIAYGKPIDRELEKRVLGGIIHSLTVEECNFTFGVELEKNIKKLQHRFPNKFTVEKALNRDLEKERNILES